MTDIPIIGQASKKKDEDEKAKQLAAYYYSLGQRDSALSIFRHIREHGIEVTIMALVNGMIAADDKAEDAIYIRDNYTKVLALKVDDSGKKPEEKEIPLPSHDN